jgi:hypothetical protein
MSRATYLLEVSGLDARPAEEIPTLAPQMHSPPENDLQNNPNLDLSPGNKYVVGGRVITSKPQATQMRNAYAHPFGGNRALDTNSNPYSGKTAYDEERNALPVTKAQYVLSLIDEAAQPYQSAQQRAMQQSNLPYSKPGWHNPNPQVKPPQGKSQAQKFADRLRAKQKSMALGRAISQSSGHAPKTPSQQQPGGSA